MMRGCIEWQQHGLGAPDAVTQATAQYRAAEDVLGQWIADCCVTGSSDYRARASLLHESYCRWLGADATVHRFGRAMNERAGITRYAANGTTWYRGIALRADGQ